MAFVLDVNLRIQDILNIQKVEAALAKVRGAVQTGAVGGMAGGLAAGGAGGMAAASRAQATAAVASAAAINKVTVANNKLITSQSKAVGVTRKAATGMGVAAKKADTFGRSIAIAGKRYAAFLTATIIPFAALAGISKATASVIEFDTAILKMRQIMGQTEQQMSGMRGEILNMATATGTSASEIARIGKIMSQAGFRGDQLAEALTALSKVPLTPSFETIDAAVEGTIAALNQFNKEGLTTTEILDVLTAVSNKFAASSEDIAKGIARGGAAFEAIGGTFREFVAVFTTIRHATRESAETVGTFMKTISSRLADPKIVNFLEGKGIRIAEAVEAGNPIEALKRIGAAMANITSIQDRIEIGTKLGGRRQISRLLALISNMDNLNNALGTAGASAGEFGKIAEVGLQGLQAQLNILVQEFNKLVQTLAEPLFVPIIRGVTTAGKAFVTFVDVIKPVIPALTTIIGFAVGFKLLALSISAAGKALAFMSGVGIGGGIPGALGALTGGGAGGVAGAFARERVQRRLAGGVGGAAIAGGAVAGGARAGVAGAALTSPLAQLAAVAGLILAADKLSESFEKTGSSSGMLAAEFIKAVGALLIATSLLSGKSITQAIGGFIQLMGPWGAAVGAAATALVAFTYAATKAVDFDVQNIIDAAAKKVSEMEVPTIEAGDHKTLQQTVGDLGLEAITGIQQSADRFEEGFSGTMAGIAARFKNLFTGKDLMAITGADAQQMINDIVGNNPELLNEILRSAIEQFGVGGLEVGLDQMLAQAFGGQIEVAGRVRQAMIMQLGGMEKIANSIEQVQMGAQVSKLANAIEKASKDFERLHIPIQISHQLGLLSDAVGNAARAIEMNVTMFDKLSQVVGKDVGVAKPGTEWSREAIEQIAREGKMGDFIDLSQLKELEGFTTDMALVGMALDDFMKSIIKSKADADALIAMLGDPKIDPFNILDPYIDKFISEYPDKIPPEAEAVFRAKAASLGVQLRELITNQAGVLLGTGEIKEASLDVLKKQQPFYGTAIDLMKTWMDAQSQQINLALSGEELLAGVDVSTAELSQTILDSLKEAYEAVGMHLDVPGIPKGDLTPREIFAGQDISDVDNLNKTIIGLAQNSEIAATTLSKYESSYQKHSELLQKIAEAQQTGEGASLGLLTASRDAGIEVLNLQVALTQLLKLLQRAPEALAEQQKQLSDIHQERVGGVDVYRRGLDPKTVQELADKDMKELQQSVKETTESINRQRQFIEAQAAIDISQAFREPADIFARALRESADAVKAFTSALKTADLRRGAGALDVKTTPEGRIYTERAPVPEAREIEQQRVIEKTNLQAALFGSEISNVLETMLQSAVNIAEGKVFGQLLRGRPEEAAANKELAQSLRDFKGFIYDIPKTIQKSGLDAKEVARATAEALKAQAELPGAREVDFIGVLQRTLGDVTKSIQTLIDFPALARQPEMLTPQLTPAVEEYLRNLARPTERVPEPEVVPRVFEDISASASDIQQAASENKMAADATTQSTEKMKIASIDMKMGGADMVAASQVMSESVQQMQSIVDTQREAAMGQQEGVSGGVEGGSVVSESVTANTEAIGRLGEQMTAVAKAVEIQTQQAAELASTEQKQTIEVEGLENNTDAIVASNDITTKTQEEMAGLGDGITKMAGAIEEGVAIDIETVSKVKVDVTGVSEASKEFTAEFEAVAMRVVKAEINIVLQQLARAAGNSETASAFESAIT